MTDIEILQTLNLIVQNPWYWTKQEQNNAIDKAISALEAQQNDAWIPVTEKLPSSDGRFEVTIRGSKGKRHVEMCNFHRDAKISGNQWGGKWEQVNVIAWRNRRTPYKEEKA